MADDILGGRLSIEDGYTSPLQKFANAVLGTENKFKQFANGISGSNQKINNETNKTYQQVDKIAQKFINQGNTVADAINKANDKVKQNQEKTIEGLSQKYMKLGMTIQQAYGKAQQDSNKIWNGDSNQGGNNPLKDFAQSFLQGGIGGIIGKLGLIGTGITAGITVMKTLNNFMEQGFDVLNKLSDGLLSPEGIKNAIEESMDFETGRMKLNLFYGNDQKGLKAYQDATYVAQKTYAGERDTVEISAKLGQLGINPSKKQLGKLVDVAGTRPEVQTDHIGLAVKEAVEGRSMMLQMYGINNKNLKKFYDDLRKTDPNEHKELKGALNKKGTAGDPQKYFNLLTDYIEKSPMNNYAETYAQTVKGKIERMTGIWETMKAEIMGIDVKTGTAKEGGVFATIAKQVDHLKDVLEDSGTANSIQKIGKAFGGAFESIGNAFNKAVTPETIDKFANAIVKIGEALAKMINRFVDSGQLDKFLANLPDLTEKLVGGKVVDKVSDVQSGIDVSQGNLINAGADKLGGFVLKSEIGLGLIKPEDALKLQTASSQANDRGFLENIKYNANELGMYLHNGLRWGIATGAWDSSYLSDTNASTAIDKNKNLSDDQKQELKDYIKNDDAKIYNNVTIQQVIANDYDGIMKSIKSAASNRK